MIRRGHALALALGAATAAGGCGGTEIERGLATPTASPTPTVTPSPPPSPTPTPAGVPVAIAVVSTSGAIENAGQAAMVRLKTSEGILALCDDVRIDDGDPFGFVIADAAALRLGETYDVVELVLGADGDFQYDAAVDRAFAHSPLTVTTTTAVTLTFITADPAASGWTEGATWADGTGCPGDPQ